MPYLSDFMGERPHTRCVACYRVFRNHRFTMALSRRRCDGCVRSEARDAINRIHNSGVRA